MWSYFLLFSAAVLYDLCFTSRAFVKGVVVPPPRAPSLLSSDSGWERKSYDTGVSPPSGLNPSTREALRKHNQHVPSSLVETEDSSFSFSDPIHTDFTRSIDDHSEPDDHDRLPTPKFGGVGKTEDLHSTLARDANVHNQLRAAVPEDTKGDLNETQPDRASAIPRRSMRSLACIFYLLGALSVVFSLQFLVHRKAGMPWSMWNHPCSSLLMGGIFRGIGETFFVTFARVLTCCFIHTSVYQYLSSVFGLAGCCVLLMDSRLPNDIFNSVCQWIILVFMICGIVKSLWMLRVHLQRIGVASSCTGSVLGLVSYLGVLHCPQLTFPNDSPVLTPLFLCLVFCSVVLLFFEYVDYSGGLLSIGCGASLGFMQFKMLTIWSPLTVTLVGSYLSQVVYIAMAFAVLEVLREVLMDIGELLVRSYVKAYIVEEAKRDKRYAPHRGKELTDNLLFLLEQERVPQRTSAILCRLFEYSDDTSDFTLSLGGHIC